MGYEEFHALVLAIMARAERPLAMREIIARTYDAAGRPGRDGWIMVDASASAAQRFRAEPARFAYDRATKRWWLRRPAPPPDPGGAMLRATGYGEARGPF